MKPRPFYAAWVQERTEALPQLAWVPPDQRAGYADALLRRLLYFHFLQAAGWLDGDPGFLRHRLGAASRRGEDRFFTDVLLPLSLAAPGIPSGRRGRAETTLSGVPCFGTPLFAPHPVEHAAGIDAMTLLEGPRPPVALPDALFERWLEFLSGWRFNLEDPSGGALTPDVLGLVCEQSAARRQEGVYYTGADITGYLCSRTILSSVLGEMCGEDHPVFAVDPPLDRYLPPALLAAERLPLESAKELAAREQRVRELRSRPVRTLDDWITLNLDLPRRAVEIIHEERDPERLHRLFRQLRRLRVLDPTCGSGAFLIAALEALEPLYAACVEAMRAHLRGEAPTPEIAEAFRAVVREADGSPSIRFYARKEAVRRNLYGVDLMPEAVETTALRLVLRILAAASPGAELCLPDPYVHLHSGDALWEPFPLKSGHPFDVVVGNPPYVENAPGTREALGAAWRTAGSPNRYAQVVERGLQLLRPDGWLGVIVPVSAVSGEEYRPLMELLRPRDLWIGTFSNRPAKLFPGVEQRLAVLLAGPDRGGAARLRTSPYHHWYEAERPTLFQRLQYVESSCWERTGMPVKSGTALAEAVWKKLAARDGRLGDWAGAGTGVVWYHDAPTYWVRALPFYPGGDANQPPGGHYHRIVVPDPERALALSAVMSSSLFYFFFKLVSNCRDFGHKEWTEFPLPPPSRSLEAELARLGSRLADCLRETAAVRSRRYPRGPVTYREYYPALALDVIDEVDAVLGKEYGLTAEELEHVRQRDRKYRVPRSVES